MVLTNWLSYLFYSTNEVCNVYSRMCIQNIFQFNTIVCHILFAPKCGDVLYIDELKETHSHINVLVSTHWGTFSFGIDSQPIEKRIAHHCSLRLVSTLRKRIVIFFNKFFFLKIENYKIFHHLLWYCDMSNEIIKGVTYYNYDDFQHLNFIFPQNFISLFWGLFNDETNLRVSYLPLE